MKKLKVAYLQLPRLDNDAQGAQENAGMAAFYLQQSLRGSGLKTEAVMPPPEIINGDNHSVTDWITSVKPDVLACTLYLWNVERTVRIARIVRKILPGTHMFAGGPETFSGHPFLFRARVFDALAQGEGESTFPVLCNWAGGGRAPDFNTVAALQGKQYHRGKRQISEKLLNKTQTVSFRDPESGIVYVETTRGCPLKCSYCFYNQSRHSLTATPVKTVLREITRHANDGAGEFRFVDPTLNCHPELPALLRELARLNHNNRLRFFGEIHAESVNETIAALLKKANFTEIEVGVQSTDRKVLTAVRRPANLTALRAGINCMAKEGVPLTLDLMCGLPYQDLDDVRKSLEWARSVPGARVQFMHTLLLPGTELRHRSRYWGLHAQPLPPYRVLKTSWLSEQEVVKAEELAEKISGHTMDCRTSRFAGYRLPDLFSHVTRIDLSADVRPGLEYHGPVRRVLEIHGRNFFVQRAKITDTICRAVKREPDVLWQFVLVLKEEEPLDLLDFVTAALDRLPAHIVDRWPVSASGRIRAARRLMIRLAGSRSFDPDWIKAAETRLRGLYF